MLHAQVREHERDDLRVLAGEEADQRARVGLGQEGEGLRRVRVREPVEDRVGVLRAERGGQQVVRHLDAAAGDAAAGRQQRLELRR